MPILWQRIITSKLTVLLAGMAAGAVGAPLLGRAARPLVRELIKAGLVAQQEIVHIAANLREELEDITAEARADLGEHEHEHVGPEHRHSHAHNRAQA